LETISATVLHLCTNEDQEDLHKAPQEKCEAVEDLTEAPELYSSKETFERSLPIRQCLFAGLDYRTELLDWTTGFTQMPQNTFFSLFQCRREANHVYSAYYFTKVAPLC